MSFSIKKEGEMVVVDVEGQLIVTIGRSSSKSPR